MVIVHTLICIFLQNLRVAVGDGAPGSGGYNDELCGVVDPAGGVTCERPLGGRMVRVHLRRTRL